MPISRSQAVTAVEAAGQRHQSVGGGVVAVHDHDLDEVCDRERDTGMLEVGGDHRRRHVASGRDVDHLLEADVALVDHGQHLADDGQLVGARHRKCLVAVEGDHRPVAAEERRGEAGASGKISR